MRSTSWRRRTSFFRSMRISWVGLRIRGSCRLAAGYAERRRYEEGKTMNRMYVVETMPTVTGFKADHRLALKPSEVVSFAVALANGSAPQGASADAQKFFAALLGDLKAARF